MTKRMLSLLLALVMTLSLCVPALAADEFAAEAVTEVEEQAPVVPVEEDAPAAAAMTEEVDEPDPVYSVEVTDEAKKALDDAITAAAKDVTAVKNHEKITSNDVAGIVAILDGGKDDFTTKYEKAVETQKQIKAGVIDIKDAGVETIVKNLTDAQEALNDKTTAELNATAIGTTILKGTVIPSDISTAAASEWTYDELVEKQDTLELLLQPTYVKKLLDAVAGADDYNEARSTAADNKVSVKSLWTAVEALYELRTGGDERTAAGKPTKADADALKKVVDEIKAKQKDEKYVVPESVEKGINSSNGAMDTKINSTTTEIETAEKLYGKVTATGFEDVTTYWTYMKSLKNMQVIAKAIAEKATLVTIGSFAVDGTQKKIDVYLTLNKSEGKTDVNKYIVTYQVSGGKETDIAGEKDAAQFSNGEDHVTYTQEKELTAKDSITFRLYVVKDGKKSGSAVSTKVFSGYDPSYTGPLFRGEAKVGDDGKITGSLTMQPAGNYGNAWVTLVVNGDDKDPQEKASAVTYEISGDKYKDVVEKAGTYTLELKVGKEDDVKKAFTRSKTTVVIPALTEKKNENDPTPMPRKCTVDAVGKMAVNDIDDLETFLAAVAKIDANLVLTDQGKTDAGTIESAKSMLNDAVAAAKKMVTDAKTLANTTTNWAKVTNSSTGVVDVVQAVLKLVTEGADLTELNKALAEAKTLKEADYTPDSWYYAGLEDLIAKVEKNLSENSYAKTGGDKNQEDVNAMVKELKAAMELLEPVGADKAALNAAIAAAKALKEEDYTEDSWKDAELANAITAAQAVADKANASVTEINAALAALKAAEEKLVKKGEEKPTDTHPAPASGTGWSYDATTGEFYFYKNNELVSNYWVGKIDGASKWDNNWYYVGSDGKLFTGMTYIDDLHGGFGWYFLQPTNANGEIGKMLTGWQYVGVQNGTDYGTCYFSAKSGEAGKCTYSTVLGDWNGTTWVK